jgi:uncharacterized protein HemX
MEIISALTTVLGILLGGGGVLFWKQDKRAKEIENEAHQSDEWRKLYERSEQDSRDKSDKIDRLYDEKKELRERFETLMAECAELKILNKELEYQKCERFECLKRCPPRFYNQNNKINEDTSEKNSQKAELHRRQALH